jgi:membrane associated rhomboid family serine protease
MLLLAVLVIVGYALYVMTPAERTRLLQAAVARLRHAKDAAEKRRTEPDPFRDALRARTPLVLVTPALAALNVGVFFCMVFGAGSLGDQATLVAWGGNFGPRTTNGEWWRLATSIFVHAGFIQLVVNMAGLAQVGLMVERLVGPLALAVTFLAAGMFASLESLSAAPVGISFGASGAIFGVYGLLLSSVMWIVLRRTPVEPIDFSELRESPEPAEPAEPPQLGAEQIAIPVDALKLLAPAAGLFLLYNMGDGLSTAELAGLVAGVVCGLVLARGVRESKPPLLHVAATMATTLVIVVASAAFLRGVGDVRPEIARVVALEDRTASAYEKAVLQFRDGRLTAQALAHMIDTSIVPELHAARARLKAVNGVPQEHQPLVASAEEYFRLRDESWRIRAEGLHKRNLPTLQKAERPERAALEALQRLRPTETK